MDQVTLLSTKTFIPPTTLSKLVPRPHLLEAFQNNSHRKVILISAPAGYGKTTLACAWINHHKIPASWFSIGRSDNNVVDFLSYVIVSIQTLKQDFCDYLLTQLRSPHPELESILIEIIHEITALNKEIYLVLEDYHIIMNKMIHTYVEFFIKHIPKNIHIVIITRSDPPLPLHLLRAKNEMSEFRINDLSFSNEEAFRFLTHTMELPISDVDAYYLNKRTEGWITGLQMAALSLKSQKDIPKFIKSFKGDDRYIMDYLVEEVLESQSNEIQKFLLQSSILDRFTASLCEEVTKIQSSRDIIELLDKENLFIIPLDNRREWYRFHHLFADLLQKKLIESQKSLLPELHMRASLWLAKNNFIPEALEHSIRARDWHKAAQLVERTFIDRMSRGEDYPTMLDRLKMLPVEIIYSSPSLCIMYAWMHSLTLHLNEAETYLNYVEANIGDSLDEDLLMQIEIIRASVALNQCDLRYTIQTCQKVLTEIAGNPSDSHIQLQNYTGATKYLAWAYLQAGEINKASQLFNDALRICKEAGSINLILYAITGLVQTFALKGQLKSSGETVMNGLSLCKEYELQNKQIHSASTLIYIEYGNYLREINKLSEAEKYIRMGLNLGIERRISADTIRDGYIHLARIKYAEKDQAGCMALFDEADQKLSNFYYIKNFRNSLEIWKATIILQIMKETNDSCQNDSIFLNGWISRQDMISNPEIRSTTEELKYLVWARWLILQCNYREAMKLLEHLLVLATEKGRNERILIIWILIAESLIGLGENKKALQQLGHAIFLAEPEGYIRIFLDEGKTVYNLLKKILPQKEFILDGKKVHTPINYVNKLIHSFEIDNKEIKNFHLPNPLSKRELEVLFLLSTGLSNKEIANRLFLSVDTIKSHLKNINLKLDVNNRKQAILRAQELGIL